MGSVLCVIVYCTEHNTAEEGPVDNPWLGIVLTCVVITGIFSYHQESKGSRIIVMQEHGASMFHCDP